LSPRPTLSDPLEEELLGLIGAGDPGALERLYAAYQKRLLLTAWHVLGYDDAEAEDAVQETFVHAMKGLARTEIHTSLYGWLNRVCVLRCIDIIRGRRRMLARQDDSLEALAMPLAQERRRRGEQDADDLERAGLLRRAVEGMDEPCRSLVRGRDIEGLSYADLAVRHEVAIGTVMSRLSRCREALKKKLVRVMGREL
jgi:RNA polymerase sigma-70 factor (ECF subfamily)